MKSCPICGGDGKSLGDGTYKCLFCGNVFSDDNFSPKTTKTREPSVVKDADVGADLFERNIKATLDISCKGKDGAWSGSGYIITESGYAVTNAHVAANSDGSPCQNIVVKVCNRLIPAKVVALADNRAGSGNGVDLAIIKLSQMPLEATKLSFEDYSNVKTGEKVYVIGNSLGDGACITSGIVSDRRRSIGGKTVLMTDCAINGGNSGGPIMNEKGLVIGTICSERIKSDGSVTKGMNYAVPVDIVTDFVKATGIKI